MLIISRQPHAHCCTTYSAISRKGYWKKCTRQSRKVLWVVLKFERMAQEAIDACLRILKESNNRRFDSYSVRSSILIISHITFWD